MPVSSIYQLVNDLEEFATSLDQQTSVATELNEPNVLAVARTNSGFAAKYEPLQVTIFIFNVPTFSQLNNDRKNI